MWPQTKKLIDSPWNHENSVRESTLDITDTSSPFKAGTLEMREVVDLPCMCEAVVLILALKIATSTVIMIQ